MISASHVANPASPGTEGEGESKPAPRTGQEGGEGVKPESRKLLLQRPEGPRQARSQGPGPRADGVGAPKEGKE
jgi:hypothetical protein